MNDKREINTDREEEEEEPSSSASKCGHKQARLWGMQEKLMNLLYISLFTEDRHIKMYRHTSSYLATKNPKKEKSLKYFCLFVFKCYLITIYNLLKENRLNQNLYEDLK